MVMVWRIGHWEDVEWIGRLERKAELEVGSGEAFHIK